MTESTHEPAPREMKPRRLTTVVVERPRCPKCGGVVLRKYRSIRDQGDGSALAWVECMDEECGHRFRLVQE